MIPNTPPEKRGPVKGDGAIHYYPPGPVCRAFLNDDSTIVGIRGPFRSGKSTTSIIKLVKNARAQPRGSDGWIRRRTAIIRNTYPELRTTTMKSWFMWVPQHLGRWREAGPPMHHIVDHVNKMDWEIVFIALDRPDDVSKLLSMELSDAYVNEAREVPKAIIDALTGRVGQYPPRWMGAECTNAQLILDTNPPDTDHWWYVLAEHDTTNERNRQYITSMLAAEEVLRGKGILREGQKLFRFYSQPSGRSAQAENLMNLQPGYYERLMAGKDDDFIKVYVDGEYGFVMDGMPMFPEYKDSTHAREFPALAGLGFRLGFDFGLTPAATLSQRTADGRWFVHDEFCTERMGVDTFAKDLKRYLAERYPRATFVSQRGDPAGDAGKGVVQTCFQILQASGFKIAEPAPTNDPVRRRESVAYLLKTLVDGDPALVIHKRCAILRKGMAGGYHRRRLQVPGDVRYRDEPEKNMYSHPCEALEYDTVSAGEDRNITVAPEKLNVRTRQMFAQNDYSMFGD